MTLRKGFARHKAIKGSELSSIAWRDQRVECGQTSILREQRVARRNPASAKASRRADYFDERMTA